MARYEQHNAEEPGIRSWGEGREAVGVGAPLPALPVSWRYANTVLHSGSLRGPLSSALTHPSGYPQRSPWVCPSPGV